MSVCLNAGSGKLYCKHFHYAREEKLFSILHTVKVLLHLNESGISVHLECYMCVCVYVSGPVYSAVVHQCQFLSLFSMSVCVWPQIAPGRWGSGRSRVEEV